MPNNYVWTTKEGRELHITEMESFHIVNTMKMIERSGYESVVVMAGGHDMYGEGWLEEEHENLRPIYENMRIELRLRKMEGTR